MPTLKQKKVLKEITENHGSVSGAMRKVGYSQNTAKKPTNLTESKGWKELLEQNGLDDDSLTKTHVQLLRSTTLDHMVFPPLRSKKEKLESGEDEDGEEIFHEGAMDGKVISDKEIIQLLADVNCTVRKIVNGEQSRHVYFWSSNDKARKEALEMAYKLKNKYPAQQHHVEGRLLIGHLIKFVEHGTVPDMESREAGEISPDALLQGVEDVESV